MNKKHLLKVSPLVGAVLLALSAPVAMAAVTAPAAGSLPGGTITSNVVTTYTYSGSTGTMTMPNGTATTGGDVIQFGGATATAPANTVTLPTNLPASSQNSGLSVGSTAILALNETKTSTGAINLPVLLNDETGNPSQIYGQITATGPLFIANANGIVVGATGKLPITTTLTSEQQSSIGFEAVPSVSQSDSTIGTGTITLATGANVGTGTIIYSNGTVNLGVDATVYGKPSTTNVNISGGTSAAGITATLNNAHGVNNVTVVSGVATLDGHLLNINGTLTNNGVLNNSSVTSLTAGAIVNNGKLIDGTGQITAVGIGSTAGSATITNNGVINESTAGLILNAMPSTLLAGNVVNNNAINFTASAHAGINKLTVEGANVDFGGTVNQYLSGAATTTPTALSATNYLGALELKTGTAAPYTGVVDVSSNLFASGSTAISGQAVRVLSGGVTAENGGAAAVTVGADGVTDPFYKNAKLGYAFSLFPGTTVGSNGALSTVTLTGPATGTANINLDGVLGNAGTTGITVTNVNNINAGSAGGFSLQGAAASSTSNLSLSFTGNVNNPNGATAAGSTAFQYNYVPVAVAAVAGAATDGVNLELNPTSTTAAQNVNLLVNGNVSYLIDPLALAAPLSVVNGSTAVNTAAVNNHLVLQSTGTINTGGAYYWPGLLYMSTIAKASDPMVLSSGTSANGITLASTLSNATAGNVAGGGGIFLETNSLAGISSTNTVLTNTNSWVNFATPAMASAYSLTSAANFYGSVINSSTPGVVNTQALPKSNFQG